MGEKYPLAGNVNPEVLDREVDLLNSIQQKPLLMRLPIYLKLGGPGFIGAALTLGAGTMTASMLAGSQFGFKTLWIYGIAIGAALFMMMAMARFTCRQGESLIQLQNKHHGWFMSRVLTAFVGMVLVAIVFNFAQYALGTHLIETLTDKMGYKISQDKNWIIYCVITSWLALSYGRGGGRGTRFVEGFMKISLGLMIICFAAVVVVVGIDWSAAFKGLTTPWLPSGIAGIDLFIASTAAAVGVMDWMMFHYTGLAKGWSGKHEKLARTDLIVGFAIPFLVINFLIIAAFAGTVYGTGKLPETASELAQALIPLLGETGAEFAFLIGFLAVPITTTVGMSLACAVAVHEAMGWKADVTSWRWKIAVLLPQIGLVAAWLPSPVLLIIVVAAFLTLSNNIVGWSFYLMFNDKKIFKENRIKSYFWNMGILTQVTLLNVVAIIYVFNRLNWW